MRTLRITIMTVAAMAALTSAWTDSDVHLTLLPTTLPTATRDPWGCVIANLTQFFDVPKPTGSLLTAIASYAEELMAPCRETATAISDCFPAKEEWCKFSAAAPATVLPDYAAYGSEASLWWAAHSAPAVELAVECPVNWYDAMFAFPGGGTWLNDTIIFAACYGEVVTTVTTSPSSTLTESTTIAATPPLGITSSGATLTATSTGSTSSS